MNSQGSDRNTAPRGRSRGGPGPAAVLLALLAAAVPAPAQEPGPDYRAYLWVYGDHLELPGLFDAIRALGFHGLSSEGGPGLRGIQEAGIPYYLDQIVGGGILSIREEVFDEAVEKSLEEPPVNVRPYCLRAPEVLKEMLRRVDSKLGAIGEHPPDFISIGDEISFTRFINPIDWCHAPDCLAQFGPFLEKRWSGRERTRSLWGLGAEAPWPPAPYTTQSARRALFYDGGGPRALVPWNDSREFADRTFAETISALVAACQERAAGVPVGFLGGQMPSAFGGFEWESLLSRVQVVEPYDHGGSHELIRSLASPRVQVLHTLFPRGQSSTPSERQPGGGAVPLAHELYHYFLHGDRGSVVFSSKEVFQSLDPLEPTALATELAPHLKRLASPGLAPYRRGRELWPQVAILHGMPSVRLHWLNDTRYDGISWVNRQTSFQIGQGTMPLTRVAWCALLEDLGLHYRFVTAANLVDGELRKLRIRALVLPRAIALSELEISAIEKFHRGGGLIIADFQPGLYNTSLEERPEPSLDQLFGVKRSDRSTNLVGDQILKAARKVAVPYPPAEPSISSAGAKPLRSPGGVPILLHAGAGPRGRALYLNLLIMDYASDRLLAPDRARWLRERIEPHLLHAGLSPRVDIEYAPESPRWPVETFMRQDGDALVLALHLNLRRGGVSVPWDAILSGGDTHLRVGLRGSHQVTDLVSGQDLGTHSQLDVTLAPDRPAFFLLAR